MVQTTEVPLTGQVIRGYELREQVGAGGFGAVYLAYQAAVDREVAIKIIRPKFANHPDFIRRFEAEAHLIARLEHPHIVPLYDYWREPDGAYLIMRWLRGGSLRGSLVNGAWSVEAAAWLLDQLAAALTIAHRSGVVHQDVKPSNILLDENGNAYLTDFGIAKDLVSGRGPVGENVSFGSPAYMAPETILREAVSPQTDIYSLGVVLYEMLTGRVPFVGADTTAVMRRHVNDPIPPLQFARPELSNELNIVIRRATAKTPQARYPDVFSMAADFRRVAQLDRLGAGAQPAPAFPRGDGGDGQLSPDERTSTLPLTLHLEPENPYKGLRPFDEADAADFFGREELITTLVEHLSGTEMLSRFLAVVGPSGSGKSSLVNAGLLPAIRDGYVPGSGRWYLARMLPGADPLGELESALLRVAADPVENLDARLRADSMGLHEVLNDLLPDEETHLLLYVDQFEEVFTQTTDERARAHFLDLLYTAISARGSHFHLIITLRADFYDRPFLYPGFGDLVRWCTEIVMPLTSPDLVRAIVRPAERVGMVVEEDLVAAIVAEVNEQPGALPLLQYALTELFERKESGQLTLKTYRETGGVLGALARRAEELYNSLDVTGQTAVRQLFLRLIGLEDGVSDTRRRAHWAEVKDLHRGGGAAMQALVDLYGRYRLLTFDRDPQTREPTVEVAHEALIREWRRLRIWLDQTREDLIVQRRLTEAMADWRNAGRDPSYLARGARLTQFEALVERQSLAFNEDERAYVAASVALRRRSTLVSRLIGVSLVLFSVLALTLAVVAYDGQRRAESEARISRSRELAVTGLTNVKDTDLALLLSLEALRSADTYEARNSLLSALQAYPYVERYLTGSVESVRAVAYSPDGRLVASAGRSTAIRVWDPASGAMVRRVESGHVDWINSLAFSPDGRFLASASADDTIQLWAVGGEAVLESVARLEGHTDDVWAVAFSPDGSLLASAGADGRVLLWSTETRQRVAALDGHTDVVYSLAFSPDGAVLASGGADEQIILWNVSTHELLGEPLIGHQNWVLSLAFSPDGHYLASGDADNLVVIWDMQDPATPPGVFSGHTGWVRDLSFSPNGTRLASASADGTLWLWDVVGKRPLAHLEGHQGAVWSLEFSPDGQTIASGGEDRLVILWDAGLNPGVGSIFDRPGTANTLAISPDGALLAAGGQDTGGSDVVQFWDVGSRSLLQTIQGEGGPVSDVAFSADGRLVATANANGSVLVWRVTRGEALGEPLQTLREHRSVVLSVAFSPDGRWLASGAQDGRIVIWNTVTWSAISEPLEGHSDAIFSLAFSPDSRYLASGSRDTTVLIWDISQRRPHGRPLASHRDAVLSVAFGPDGDLLASAGRDGTVILWQWATGQKEADLIGHTDWINGLSFSPDGTLLVSASEDDSLIVWDVAAERPVGLPFLGHAGGARDVVFTPDGRRVISGGLEPALVEWRMTLGAWRERACQVANRNLNPTEWAQYFPDLVFVPTCPNLP